MKFDKSLLKVAFAQSGLPMPTAQNPECDTLTLVLAADSGLINANKELHLMIEPVIYVMKHQFDEDVTVQSGPATKPVIRNVSGDGCVYLSLGTKRPQELMDILGDMYRRLDYFFMGVTDKGEVLLPKDTPDMSGEFKMDDGLRGVLNMTTAAYGKKPGAFKRF